MDLGSLAEWAGVVVPVGLAGVGAWRTRKRLLVQVRQGDLVAAGVRTYVADVINTGWMALDKNDLVRAVTLTIHRGKWESFMIEYVQNGDARPEPVGFSDLSDTSFVVDKVDLNRGDRLTITMFVRDGRDLLPEVSLQAKSFRLKRRTYPRKR